MSGKTEDMTQNSCFATVGLTGGLLDYVKLHRTEAEANADADRIAINYHIDQTDEEEKWHDEESDVYVEQVEIPSGETGEVARRVLRCVELCREGGRRGIHDAFKELVNWMGTKLGLTNECGLSPETKTRLDADLNLNDVANLKADHLGTVYSNLELGNKHLGQCFTPIQIADFMVVAVGCPECKPGQRILDPCVGTGVFLISALKVIVPGVELYGIEIDPILYRAALVQLTLFTDHGKRNPFYLLCGDALLGDQDWSQANRWK